MSKASPCEEHQHLGTLGMAVCRCSLNRTLPLRLTRASGPSAPTLPATAASRPPSNACPGPRRTTLAALSRAPDLRCGAGSAPPPPAGLRGFWLPPDRHAGIGGAPSTSSRAHSPPCTYRISSRTDAQGGACLSPAVATLWHFLLARSPCLHMFSMGTLYISTRCAGTRPTASRPCQGPVPASTDCHYHSSQTRQAVVGLRAGHHLAATASVMGDAQWCLRTTWSWFSQHGGGGGLEGWRLLQSFTCGVPLCGLPRS